MRRRAAEVSAEQQRESRELRLLRRRSAAELVRWANGNREVPAAAPREGRVLRVTAVAVEVIPEVVVLAEPEEVEVQSERETVCRLIICYRYVAVLSHHLRSIVATTPGVSWLAVVRSRVSAGWL